MNPASYRADGLSLHRPYTRHSGACLCGQQRPQEVLTEAGPCPSVFLICRSTRSEKGVLSHRARRRNHPGTLGLAPVQGFIELGEVKRPQLRRGRIERHPGVLRGDDPAAASTVCRYQASTRVTASWRTCAVSCARGQVGGIHPQQVVEPVRIRLRGIQQMRVDQHLQRIRHRAFRLPQQSRRRGQPDGWPLP